MHTIIDRITGATIAHHVTRLDALAHFDFLVAQGRDVLLTRES